MMPRRSHDPYARPTTPEDARASLEENPLTYGELEVNEILASEGVTSRPQDYMRLVEFIRAEMPDGEKDA